MFWKRKPKKVEVVEDIIASSTTIEKPKPLTPRKPKTKHKVVSYTSIVDGLTYTGIVLDTLVYEKAKSITTRDVYVISVFMNNRSHILTPQLKWVNGSCCIDEPNVKVDTLSAKYFDYDWLVEDEKTKRLKRICSKASLQEEDGGEIWD